MAREVTRPARNDRQIIVAALERAVSFLEATQLGSGELPIYASSDPTLAAGASIDPSIFPNALAAWSLSRWPGADAVRDRICDFLAAEMLSTGLWRHWPRSHPHHASLPPDLDDSSCASLALARAGRPAPDNRALLLANRDARGRFFTWIAPRLRWSGLRHSALTWRQLAHAPTLYLFFTRTSAEPRDVDAAVNANTLFHLGRFDGEAAVVELLVDALRQGRERHCDKWYENPFVIWYFFARALAGRSDDAETLLVRKLDEAELENALEAALALSALIALGEPVNQARVESLLAAQQPDGSWPRAALYHGGRARLPDGRFAEPHPDTPRWGSEALTTAFAIEALGQSLQQS